MGIEWLPSSTEHHLLPFAMAMAGWAIQLERTSMTLLMTFLKISVYDSSSIPPCSGKLTV